MDERVRREDEKDGTIWEMYRAGTSYRGMAEITHVGFSRISKIIRTHEPGLIFPHSP
jgi:hypothetical protein